MEQLLGAYPSPKDPRDYPLLAELTPDQREMALPESFTAWPIPAVLKQRGGTCVGFSSTYMRLAQQRRDLGVWLHLDPYDLYREARKRDGLNDALGEGSTVRGAMRALKEYGQKTTDGVAPEKIDGPGEAGLAGQKVIAAAIESLETGKVVAVA